MIFLVNQNNYEWTNSRKNIYTYDDNNNCLTSIDYYWNSIQNTWVNSRKSQFTYLENGSLLSESHQLWNDDLNEWVKYIVF